GQRRLAGCGRAGDDPQRFLGVDARSHGRAEDTGTCLAAARPRRYRARPERRPARRPDAARGMIAFISDIHSNTEALTACWRKIDTLGVDRVICLGDVIGYGPEPRQTLLQVMQRAEFSLLGNHEHGAMFYASDFNARARAAIDWTRDQLNR